MPESPYERARRISGGDKPSKIRGLIDRLSPDYDYLSSSPVPSLQNKVQNFKDHVNAAAEAHASGDEDGALDHLIDARNVAEGFGGKLHHHVTKVINDVFNFR